MASASLCQQLKEKRALSGPHGRNIIHRHQTIQPHHEHLLEDHALQTITNRNRRISSSAAARRFPKDFFKEDCLQPIKTAKYKHKQHDNAISDTFSHKKVSKERNQQNSEQSEQDTPKFKQKDSEIHKKSQAKWSSVPVEHNENWLIGKKIGKMPLMQKKGQDVLQTIEPFGAIPMISNFNLTLGQKDSLGKMLAKKKAKRSIHEKENNGKMQAGCRGGDIFRIRRKLLN